MMVDNEMADDDLEPAANVQRVRNPRSRKPTTRPKRVPQALRSLNEDRPFAIRKPTEEEAREVKSELASAVYYLNRWEGYDVRVRPLITEHYEINFVEFPAEEVTKDMLYEAEVEDYDVEHYWKCNFHVKPPEERGFRSISRAEATRIREKSAESRGVAPPKSRKRPKPKRTVAEMSDED